MGNKNHEIRWISLLIIIPFITVVYNCEKKTIEQQETILAKIGNQSITVKDFKMRTELTVRPKYPVLNNEEIKRIYLNNLIAEKLMAMEGQREKRLIDNPVFQAHMKGIQEQKMREQLYSDEISACAEVDSNDMKRVFPIAGREYNVSFYTVHDDSLAKKIQEELKKNTDLFEDIYHELTTNENIPQKIVKFKDPDPVIVNDSLFSEPLEVGQVIGPVKIERNNYIIMRVDDWKYYPAISTSDIYNRWTDVKNKLIEKNSYYTWRNYVSNLMNGKKVEFEKETYIQLSKIFFQIYGNNDNALKQQAFSEFMTGDTEQIQFENGMFENLMLDYPFFTIDGKVWTVRDFREVYMSHPLVFNYKSTNLKDFQGQFRTAIIFLISDHFLTKEAYKRKLDKHPLVKRTRAMWEDAYVALYHRDQYMTQMHERDDFDPQLMKGKNNYLNKYVDSLQHKYSSKIAINEAALNKIKLSTIDMYAIQPNVPYPAAVPGFPEFSQDGEFDYGRIIHDE